MVLKVPPETPPPKPREEYPLREGSGPPPTTDQAYIAVVCPVCNTRMHAAKDRVGREMLCPDCHTPVVVSPPAEAKRRRPAVPVEEYPLREEADWAARGSRPADQVHVPVTCPVCNTRMKAGEDQVGREMVCPD